MTTHEKFTADMEAAGFEVEPNYNGWYHWRGPGVICEIGELQDVIRATPVQLKQEQSGLGLIVHPVADAIEEWPGDDDCLLTMPLYQPGDPAPKGYMQWHEWAKVQHRGGLRQGRCRNCGDWLFPQEVKGHKCKGVNDVLG